MNHQQLQQFCKAADPFYDGLVATFDRYGIATADRVCCFLAQVAHESGGFRYVRELWGPTPQQKKYERVMSTPWPTSPAQAKLPAYAPNRVAYALGNTQAGDGALFKGHGLIQTTGRANHAAASQALFGDMRLLDDPKLLEQPLYACLSAGWFWDSRKLNELADAGDMAGITVKINGGMTHFDDGDRSDLDTRMDWYDRAIKIFNP